MIALTKRNLKLFFRDRASVFFSLLTVLIIIALYAFFLGDMMVRNMEDAGISNAKVLTGSWVMAGLLTVISVTATLGALGTMVEDKSKRILNDFSASPLKRSSLIGGYMLSMFLIGMIMSVIALILAEAYIALSGGTVLPLASIAKILGCLALSVLSGGSIVFFMASFFKSQNAFGNANIVIGTLIGFLTGIYIPIGELPGAVQAVIKAFPPSHSGALLRQIMMDAPLKEAFAGAPAQALNEFRGAFGVTFSYGNQTASRAASLIVLLATAAVFCGLALLNISRKKKSV